jgi:nucleotide-binding universal stress UspA family protein
MRMILQSTLKELLPEGGHRTASERMFRRVVVAAELSPAHERLLADMTELAARTGGKVTGVLAARPRSIDGTLTHPWLERTRATQASAFVRPYWAGPDATSSDALIAYERENGADMVGVTAAPTSVWRRGFVDPDVRAACAASSSPVWVAGRYPAFATSSAPAPSIVAGVNLLSGSEAIVRFADTLATAISARLFIAYVLPEVTEASLTDSLTNPDTVLAESVARERLKELASLCASQHETSVLRGDSVRQIKRLAADAAPAVIVAGRSDQSGLSPIATRLIRHPRYPVVIVPHP